jgi:hypothetical protein
MKDFKDFLEESHSPSDQMNESILSFVQAELNPSHTQVFLKFGLIQGFVGLLTMLFCPQFQMSLTNNHKLFHYFHHNFGEVACMLFCSAIFIGTGAIFAATLLNKAEIRKIRSSRFLYYLSLTGISIMSFMVLGAKVYLTLTSYWAAGAIVSGVIFFELSYRGRLKLS